MPRRSTRRRSSSDDGEDADGAGAPAEPARRVSSRATKFASSMQEPKDNLRDILPPATPELGKKARAANKKRRTSRDASDDDDDGDSDAEEMMVDNSSDEEEAASRRPSRSSRAAAAASSSRTSSRGRGRGRGTASTGSPGRPTVRRSGQRAPPQSPFKSPAKRHSTRRRTVRTEVIVEESSEEESDLESEDESAAADESDGGSGAGGDEELDELKIQRIIASRTETRRKWREICSRMNTSEIENGSRWFQDWAATEGTADDDNVFEERFLVKWSDLSYLHCSWESQDDLVAQVDNAKNYLTTFFRKSVNGLLFDADERGDGEFFDPSYVQIERVLEIAEEEEDDDEDEDEEEEEEEEDGVAAAAAEEDPANKLPRGIIMDKDHPDYESGTGRQFLIKWGNTPYSDSTYEFERDLILAEAEYEEHVKAFEARSAKPTKKEMTKTFKHQEDQKRRLYKIFGEKGVSGSQEDKIAEYQKKMEAHVFANGGQVRDYQAEGISWMISNYINNRSSILADEMGLGKTIQTAVFINTLATELGRTGPFLIVAPLSTIPHWYREFSGWTNLNTIVYHGSAKDRDYIREFEMPYHEDKPDSVPMNSQYLKKCHKRNAAKWERTWMVDVLITTPEMLVTDDFAELTAVKWDALVVDEAHRLKNHSSKLAQNLRDDRFNFDSILLLTGTPIQNNMQEMWTLLNIVDPDGFDDLDGFLERYGDIKSKERVDELHETIRPYILRRLKEDVEKSVPPKEETLIEVELTVLQKQYYRALYEKNVQFLHRNQKKALDGPSINNLAIQLRKCCNHPFLLNGVEEEVRAAENVADEKKAEADFLVRASGKLVLLDKLLPKLKEDGHRVLIFSQFKIMLDILEDYLELRGMKHERIDGSITGKKRQMAIDRFQAKETEGKESSFVMLLSTRAGGVGINLTAADTCIIFDSDWNPQNDLQAQARCHRIGQTKSVKVYRLLTRKTYEMQMFHQSSLKMGLDQAVLQGIEGGTGDGEGVLTKEEVERLLRHGAYDIFNEEKSGSSEQESKEFESQDIDSILARRAKTVVHENTGSKSNAAGGTFSKASFRAQNTGDKGDGTGDGDDAGEDVDIDDPDFWKKMVGEAQVDESDNLHGKKRKRKQANYSEKDYDKVLRKSLMFGGGNDSDSSDDDDQSVSSEGSESDAVIDEDDDFEFGPGDINNEHLAALRDEKKALAHVRERHKWGGKGKGDWSRKDCEAMLDQLKDHGYGNLPWEDFFAQVTFSNADGLGQDEVQRMCWSFCLSALRETAEEMVRQDARTAARRAEKKRESGDGIAPASADGAGAAADANDAAATASDDGGVLGSAKEPSEADVAEAKEKLDNAFDKLWQENSTWASNVLRDALAYAKSHPPRREAQVQELFASHAERSAKKPLPSLTTAFNESIWPSLQSRGWKDEPMVDKGTRFVSPPKKYIYKEKTYKTIGAVLDAATIIHPELANAIETIISSAKKDAADNRSDNEREEKSILDKISGFDGSMTTVENIEFLMRHFAPPQLLADRENDNRYKMGKRFTNLMLNSNTAHDIVSRAQSNAEEGGTNEDSAVSHKDLINNLAKLITLDKRTAVPHPKWTAVHDAVLIAAIAKHGWIDRDSACKAMVEDKSIKWGRPFDDGDFAPLKDSVKQEGPADTADTKMLDSDPQPSSAHSAGGEGKDEENAIVSDLKSIAPRVLNFLQTERSLLVDLKGFDQDLVARTYGLVKEEDAPEDGDFVKEAPPSWRFDETLLTAAKVEVVKSSNGKKADEEGDTSDELSDLPSRKELRRRAKSIVKFVLGTSTGSASSSTLAVDSAAAVKQGQDKVGDANRDAALSTPEDEFCRIDQMDKRNIFLVELLNGIIKLSTKVSAHKQMTKKLLQYALKEVDCYIEAYTARTDPQKVEDWKKIKSHIDLVKKTIQKHHRQGKNVLRVMLGIDAVAAKKGNEGLFPVVPKYGNIPAISSKKKQSKSKSSTVGAKDIGISSGKASTARKKKRKKTQLESYESALGDVAINRALSLGMEMDPALIGSDSKALKLSSIETLILSVICSQGLPAYTENWESLIDQNFNVASQTLPGQEFVINWFRMGGVVLNAADVWATIAHRNYEAKLLEIQANAANNSSEADLSELQTQARQLEVDLKRKENAKVEATELRDNPHQLAQRTIMMLAALQEKMGSIDTKSKKPPNEVENGLGTKVLHWLSHELSNWARALQVADQVSGKPHAAVGYDYDKNDDAEKVAAVFDKRGCRTVFLQVAQQTRLRSLFVRNGANKVAQNLPDAVVLSEVAGDDWDYRPSWWICNTDSGNPTMLVPDDTDLLNGILDYGYSGFDEMVKMTDSFQKRCEQSDGDGDVFTRATVQDRINHLTRELHELDEAANVQQLLSERKAAASAKKESSVQSGINSFFVAKGKTTASPKKAENGSGGADVIEINDGDDNTSSGVKRNADASSLDTSPASPEKKPKMDQDRSG